MIEIRNLETFVWVATLRNFRAAAQKLNTTQPAISQRIASLEATLGVKLLERNTRGVTLTAKGGELLAHAQGMLDLKQEMMDAARSTKTIAGQVRLGVSETIVQTWLPRYLEEIHARYPELNVELEVDTSPVLREQIRSHHLNLAFLMGPILAPNVENIPLCQYPLAWLASPKLGLHREKATLAQIGANPVITYPATSQPHQFVRDLLTDSGIHSPRMYGSASLSVVVRMTLDAIGVAVITPVFLQDEIRAGSLCLLDVADHLLPDLAFTASWSRGPDEHIAATLAKLAQQIAENNQIV
ncbi:LysR family transcriptional regulator [Zwartia vadi]|uniref:LysR family transcriptional regulator n=1 Tax=Zwartia vadi TaxID=3058168 RepID=UPI0025B2831A|nr:LysR family transcriptional regulator [Zwartia vadi]MDN3987389.1 LysR family transcriptional regulator [Zwartia vadi]